MKTAAKALPPLQSQSQLAWRALAAACVCNCAHFYSICSLFSYAGVMTAELGWASDRDHAGNIAGFLQTANIFGRIPTSGFWGFFAEWYGIKNGLCVAMTSLAIGNLAFGLSTDSVFAAVAVRFAFLGLGSGWTTFVGPLTRELGGPERQVEITGKIFASGTCIQLLGPAVGGWTYGLFPRFPAIVPASTGAAIALLALVATTRWMPTMAPTAKPQPQGAVKAICKHPMPLLILLRSTQGAMNFAFFEVVPLWAITSSEVGGLALSESQLGVVLAVSAICSGFFMGFILPRVAKRLGLQRAIVVANFLTGSCLAAIPFSMGVVTLTVLHVFATSLFGLVAASYIACLNNSAPPERLATLNGVSVTFESMAKCLGPLVSSLSFAGSLSLWGRPGRLTVFFVMSVVQLLLAVGTYVLPAEVGGPALVDKTKASPCSRTRLEVDDPEREGGTGNRVNPFGLEGEEDAEDEAAPATAASAVTAPGHKAQGHKAPGHKAPGHKRKARPVEKEPLKQTTEGACSP